MAFRLPGYSDADVILPSIQNSRHVKQKLPSFGALEVYADGNLATCQCLDIGPPWFQLPNSFPNIISKYFYISGATPPENVTKTPVEFDYLLSNVIIQGEGLFHRFFFPHTSVKHPDARLQNCKACGPINCWEGLINWGPFLMLGWDKILTPTWLFTYQKYCFLEKAPFLGHI